MAAHNSSRASAPQKDARPHGLQKQPTQDKDGKEALVIGLTSEVGYFMSIQDEVSIITKNMLNKIIYIFKKLKL